MIKKKAFWISKTRKKTSLHCWPFFAQNNAFYNEENNLNFNHDIIFYKYLF